ncbi:hypothetical protein SO802_018443 [Lithocarpus litseifolius]|uniref:RNase H type-1 domain-containing protein n=1 Tax=Lithocarpus litseifolius TaxID=425828 RepID=A0AAW2CKU5_9ROSI
MYVRRKIQATPFPCVARNEDKLAWNPSPKGPFDLRSAYLLASEPLPDSTFQGKWIWKLDTLPRIQTFIWKCMHKSIGALWDCHVLKRIWHRLGISFQDTDFYSANLQDWITSNCRDKRIRNSGQVPWSQTFMFAIWTIWKGRNQLVFENKELKLSLALDINHRALEFFYCVGFARKIGVASSFTAELWALRDGLLLCRQRNAQAVAVEVDARAIVDAFNHHTNSNTIVSTIMDDCRLLVNQIPQVSFRHIYREANRSVDWLANFGLKLDFEFESFPGPPVDLIAVWKADSHGLYCNRQCTEPVFVV